MRYELKLVGLAILASLSMMAIDATVAQAAEFRIGSPLKTFAEAGVTEKTVKGSGGPGEILTVGMKIHCTSGTGTGVIKKGGIGTAEALITGCTVLESKFCKIYEDLGIDKNVATLLGEGSIRISGEGGLMLVGKKHYLLTSGLGEKSLLTLFDIYGALCPLIPKAQTPLHIEVFGSAVVYLPDALEDKKVHEAQSLSLEEMSEFPADKRFLGANEAHVANGSGPFGAVLASMELTSGEIWGAE